MDSSTDILFNVPMRNPAHNWKTALRKADALQYSGKTREALALLENTVPPSVHDYRARKAEFLLGEGRYTETLALLGRGARYAALRGAAKFKLGQNEPALKELVPASKEHDSLEARLWLARALTAMGNTEKARRVAASVAAARPTFPWGYIVQAEAELASDNYDGAMACIRRMRRQAPKSYAALSRQLELAPLSHKGEGRSFILEALRRTKGRFRADALLPPAAAPRRQRETADERTEKANRLFHLATESQDALQLKQAADLHGRFLELAAPRQPVENIFASLFFLRRYREAFKLLAAQPGDKPLHNSIFWSPLGFFAMRIEPDYFQRNIQLLRRTRVPVDCVILKDYFIALFMNFLNSSKELLALEDRPELNERKYHGISCFIANRHLLDGNYEKAIRAFIRLRKSFSEDWVYLCRMAEAYMCAGRGKEAFLLFDRACALNPNEGRTWKGEMLLFTGKYKEALPLFSNDVLYTATWRGATRLMLGDIPEAIKDLEAELARNSSDAEAKVWLARAYLEKGATLRARELCDELIAARPHHFWAHMIQASAFIRTGNTRETANSLAKAREALPGFHQWLEDVLGNPGTTPRGMERFISGTLKMAKGNMRPETYILPVTFKGFRPDKTPPAHHSKLG